MQDARVPFSLAMTFIAGLLAGGPIHAADITGNYHPLSMEIQYLSDPTGTLTLEHLLADPSAHPFAPAREGKPEGNFMPVWLQIELDFHPELLDERFYLFTRIENLYDIRMYRPDGKGGYSEWITGNDYPVSSREVDSPRYGFRVEPSTEKQTLYMRYVGGPGSNQLPWDLIEEGTYLEKSHNFYSLDIAAFSAITTLLVFNLFIALSLRKAEYLYYSAYVLSVTMGLATLDGLGFYYIWPDSPGLNSRAMHGFNLLSSATRLLTIVAFLDVRSFAPNLYRGTLGVLGMLATGFVAVALVGVTRLPPYTLTALWAIGICFGLVICGHAVWKRVRLAIPLFITLLIPSVAAILQAILTVNVGGVGIIELQIAKIGFVIHVLVFSLCLAAQIKIETESRILALHDSLTGLPGSTLLRERFELAANLCRRQGMKTAIFFVDLDGFKAVNDTMGHAIGDQLLVQVAGRIQVELRRTDTVARIGGDEFVVLLTQVREANDVTDVAEKLLATVARPCLIQSREARVSASIGIAIFPDDGEDLESLLGVADRAMYDSKGRGKNTFTFSGEDVDADADSDMTARPTRLAEVRSISDNAAG